LTGVGSGGFVGAVAKTFVAGVLNAIPGGSGLTAVAARFRTNMSGALSRWIRDVIIVGGVPRS
jgi:hypothetical protein